MLGQTYRLSAGADASAKLLHLTSGISAAFASPLPSLHPFDLCVALLGRWLCVSLCTARARTPRSTARVKSTALPGGTAKDIAPYIDPKFDNNILLTQTERLTMTGRPKDPRRPGTKMCW